MKITHVLRLFLYSCLIVLSISSCEEEPTEQQEQPVQFAFNSEQLAENGRLADLDDARAIVISIKNSSGETVLNMEKIEVYKLEGTNYTQKFISKPVSLMPGGYEITDFLVVDEDNNVIYVTPKEGSDNSNLVHDPLPIHFSVTANSINEISVQVVDATTDPVESFGYVSFSIRERNTLKFRIQPFIVEYEYSAYEYSPHWALTEAYVEVSKASSREIVFEGMISPGNNLIEIPFNSWDSFVIKVTKEFYEPYEKTFTNEELIATEGDPIEVILESKTEFIPILSTDETIVSLLVPPGDHSKLLYTTNDGLYKVNIGNLQNPGTSVFVAAHTGYLRVDFFGNLRLGDYVSTDQGETWTHDPEEGPRTFAEIDGTYYGRIGSELYGKPAGGEWELLSELSPYTKIVAYEDRLYTAPGNIHSDGFYVTEDGINFEEIPANVMDIGNSFFKGTGKLFLNTYFEGGGFIVLWDGSSWTVDNSIHEYDPEFNRFYIEEYKNNLILVENDQVKVIQFNNCSPGACEAQLLDTFVSEYVFHAFSTISGREMAGDVLILQTVADNNGETHLYAMDLSDLELE
ncbi:hypothetical protein C900_00406 [Fulvivirga imtechensis AK7]|uniref:Uncharacterized protein n=1 Tax=Fulvivirga imtechensis AK7 TaxID=1237149 RepID=L8JLJ0_9BACT|nr:DUF4458 domain-containing protein [Fulvivirga imtechensis]ELR68374.1 hypothetical protein C900_00406 [Fulvivirga imtechensis AK7]